MLPPKGLKICTFIATPGKFFAAKAGFPVSTSYITQPKAHTSLLNAYGRPSMISGALHNPDNPTFRDSKQ